MTSKYLLWVEEWLNMAYGGPFLPMVLFTYKGGGNGP